MIPSVRTKQEIISQFQAKENDTGFPEVQVALITQRTTDIENHIKIHKKDFSAKRTLLMLIAKRNTFLKCIAAQDKERYIKVCQKLGLRIKKN